MNKNKIGLVLHPYKEAASAGLGRSIYNLAKEIVEQDQSNEYIIFTKGEKALPDWSGTNWSVISLPERPLWLDRYLWKFRSEIDVWVFFTPVAPLFVPLKKSLVVVHDMGAWILNARSLKNRIIQAVQKQTLLKATKIIAVSHCTKEDIVRFIPAAKERIEVVYNGFDVIGGEGQGVSIPNKYFLCMGVVKKRKNPLRIVRAFEQFKSMSQSEHMLVFAGTYSSDSEVFKYAKASEQKNSILFLDHVSDSERTYLYTRAFALVFPSLFEGFGLPILEAMSASIPVITSKGGATEEVALDAALLVNPKSVVEIAEAMLHLEQNPKMRSELIEKGKVRAKQFSWGNAGKAYVSIIESL